MVNQALLTAIKREMPSQPDDDREWFILLGRTAVELRSSFAEEFPHERSTIKAFDKIIKKYRIN